MNEEFRTDGLGDGDPWAAREHAERGFDTARFDDVDGKPIPPDPQEANGSREIILTPASMIKPKPVRWMWDTTAENEFPTSAGRIPQHTLCIAAGQAGLGKSQFAIWMAAHVTKGTLPGVLYGSPRCVMYAATEDAWEFTIVPRLIAAGADLNRVFRIDVIDDEDPHAVLTLPRDISVLGKAAEAHSVGLVVLDPLLSVLDAGINDYRAAEVRRALEPLKNAAERYCFTILGLAHFTKNGTADPLARLSGSGAFGQVVRSAFAFARQDGEDGDSEFILSQIKNNLGRENLPSFSYRIEPVTVKTEDGPAYVSRFDLGTETSTTVKQVMRDEANPGGLSAAAEAAEWMRGYLADVGGYEKRAELHRAACKAGYTGTAVERARKRLNLVTHTTGFGKDRASVWYLPEAAPQD